MVFLKDCFEKKNNNNNLNQKKIHRRQKSMQNYPACKELTLSTLGKIFNRRHIEIFFLLFSRKHSLLFHANCLKWRQFAWNSKSIINLLSAVLAHGMYYPQRQKTFLKTSLPSEDLDQSAHSQRLIRIFTVFILDSQGCKVS